MNQLAIMARLDGQMFGDFRPDPTNLWSDRDLHNLRRVEERHGDEGRAERIERIDREIARRQQKQSIKRKPQEQHEK